MKISLIAAVDEAFGLGRNNALLCHLPADLQHFKSITMGKPNIMGRKTFDSIGRALPGRKNIVLSRQGFKIDDVYVVDTLEKGLLLAEPYPEVMMIGGAGIFEQVIGLAQHIYLTQIHARFDADVFFPQLDEATWCCSERIERVPDQKNPYAITFLQYQKRTSFI